MKKKEKKPEVKKPEEQKKISPEIKETTDLKEAIQLQKEGWVVTEVRSMQIGIRPKTWVLKK